MSDYHEEVPISKRDDAMLETDGRERKKEGLSRRKFIRNAAVGAAAAGATFALKGGGSVLAQSGESGQVEVDAILLSYVAAPLGSTASTTNTYTRTHATTLRLTAESNRTLTLSSSVTVGTESFNVGGSTTYRQSNSTSLTNAITVRRSITEEFSTPAPGAIGNTVFIGLLAPEMQMDGYSGGFSFRFLRAVNKFGVTYTDLQASRPDSPIKPATASSFLSKYITTRPNWSCRDSSSSRASCSLRASSTPSRSPKQRAVRSPRRRPPPRASKSPVPRLLEYPQYSLRPSRLARA